MSGQVLARFGDPALQGVDIVAPAPRDTHLGAPDAETRAMVQLTALPRNATGTVAGVRVHAPGADATSDTNNDTDTERMALRLIEIGFVQGAQLRVIAFGQPGNDPIGVRVGGRGGISTFALRRQEAACVWVWADKA